MNEKITIVMAIHDKNDCLENTLTSIVKQNNFNNFNPFFIFVADGCSEEQDPLPIIETFFNKEKFLFHRNKESIGFENLPSQFMKLIPSEIENVVFQSCDVIWYDQNLLSKIVEKITNRAIEDSVIIPSPVLNLEIPEDVHKNKEEFFNLLKELTKDPSLYGEHKKPAYGYLAVIKKNNLKKVLDMRLYNSDGACDLVLKDHYAAAKINMVLMEAPIIHQKHFAIIYGCSSLSECTHPCTIRRTMVKKGMKFPFKIGYYNPKTNRWTDHPSYH